MWIIYLTTVFAFFAPERAIEENPVVVVTIPLEAYGQNDHIFSTQDECDAFMTRFVIIEGGVEPQSGWIQGRNDFGDLTFSHGPVASKDGKFTTSRKIGCMGSVVEQ